CCPILIGNPTGGNGHLWAFAGPLSHARHQYDSWLPRRRCDPDCRVGPDLRMRHGRTTARAGLRIAPSGGRTLIAIGRANLICKCAHTLPTAWRRCGNFPRIRSLYSLEWQDSYDKTPAARLLNRSETI